MCFSERCPGQLRYTAFCIRQKGLRDAALQRPTFHEWHYLVSTRQVLTGTASRLLSKQLLDPGFNWAKMPYSADAAACKKIKQHCGAFTSRLHTAAKPVPVLPSCSQGNDRWPLKFLHQSNL